MNQRDLDILLREGEGSMLEYKASLSSSLARELAAFANSAGGKILLGVRNDGTVVGMRDTNDLRAQIQDIARNCDPPVNVLVEAVGNVRQSLCERAKVNPFNAVTAFSGVREQAPRSSRGMRYGISSAARVRSALT